MLQVLNLEAVYDDVMLVLRGVSLTVPPGKIVALLGANGAGKTTLLRAVSGLLDVHDGEVTKGGVILDGRPIHRLRPAAVVRRGVTQVMEGRRIFAELTVEENLRLGAHTRPRRIGQELERIYDLFPVLAARRRATAGYLSGGEQQMLAMGRALMSEPRYLLLDEPSPGLAPRLVEQVRDLIVDINKLGTAVLLVEQNATMALSIAEHGYVLETGKVVLDKPAADLLADEDIREFYLGLRPEGTVRAFAGVSFEVGRRELFAVIGPNGAGKTSIFNVISGVYRPQQGRITFDGTDLVGLRPHRVAALGVARTFQNVELFAHLTVLENLMLGRHHHIRYGTLSAIAWFGRARREEIANRAVVEDIIDFLELEQWRRLPVGLLPYGVQKRVELGRALAMQPKLLLLDEPVSGMNLEETEDMARFVLDIRDELDLPMILVEHDMGLVMDLADRVLVVDFGVPIATGTPAEVQDNPDVIRAYLGEVQRA